MAMKQTFRATSGTARLEIAQEALGCLIAFRSQLIFTERRKTQPRPGVIDHWKSQRNALFDLARSLNCDDQETIEDVIATYSRSARAVFESHE